MCLRASRRHALQQRLVGKSNSVSLRKEAKVYSHSSSCILKSLKNKAARFLRNCDTNEMLQPSRNWPSLFISSQNGIGLPKPAFRAVRLERQLLCDS